MTRRPLHFSPEPFRTNLGGTFTLLEATRSYWTDALPPPIRLHVSTDEVYGSIDDPQVDETPLTRQQSLLRFQGGRRSSGSRLPPHLRPAGARHQLLEQLRPLSVPREADPADDSERLGRQTAAGVRRRPEHSRLAVRRRSLPGVASWCSSAARRAKRTTSAAIANGRISTSCGRFAPRSIASAPACRTLPANR